MDEDGAGNRSPPRARSPDARLLPPSRFGQFCSFNAFCGAITGTI